MRGYTTLGSNATGNASKTLVNVIASNLVRPTLFEFTVGSSAAPADQAANLALRRHTAVGTAGTSPTPKALDSADVAAVATAGAAHSAEPTYTDTLFSFSMNQRATFRHVATPGFEFKAPATNNAGLGLQLVAATASLILDGTIAWYE